MKTTIRFGCLLALTGILLSGCTGQMEDDIYSLQGQVVRLAEEDQKQKQARKRELDEIYIDLKRQAATLQTRMEELNLAMTGIERDIATSQRDAGSSKQRIGDLETALWRRMDTLQKEVNSAVATKIVAEAAARKKSTNSAAQARAQITKKTDTKIANSEKRYQREMATLKKEIDSFYSQMANIINNLDGMEGAIHVVAKGETLGLIAQKYGIRLKDLAAANQIKDPAKIKIGQELVIPQN